MTIMTATQALAPQVYWPLDDLPGTVASDASGFGRPGVYSGAVSFHAQGPETGTFAVLVNGQGVAQRNTPTLVTPWSYAIWVAVAGQVTPGSGIIGQQGAGPLISEVRGDDMKWVTSGVPNVVGYSRGGLGAGAWGNIGDQLFHQLVITHDAANNVSRYIDGALNLANAGNVINALIAGDKFFCGSGQIVGSMYLAHAALWNVVLTGAQVATLYAARATPQEPIGSNVGIGTAIQGLQVDISKLLSYVSRLYQNAP